LIFCLFGNAQAQMIIDSSDFPAGGIALPRNNGSFIGATAGNAGAAQSYDFSSTNIWWQDSVFYYDNTQIPWFADHPGTTVAGFEWWRDAFLLIWYYEVDANAIWASGVTAYGDFGLGDTAVHGNHFPGYTDTILSTDYVYGNTETEISAVTIPLNPVVDLQLISYKIIEVDGWGTLQTPFNNWDSILRVKYIELNFDTLFVNNLVDTAWVDTLYYYKYFAKGLRHPVVIAHTDFFGNVSYLEYTYDNFPPVIYGCTDSLAINFNPMAGQDDSSCAYCGAIPYTLSADTSICAGDTITLMVSGGTKLLWSTGDTGSSVSVSPGATTVYSVYINDTSGCWELATSEVTVYQNVQSGFWVDPNKSFDSVLFVNTSLEATNYFWDFDDTINGTSNEKSPEHLYSSPGTKNVMLVASNPCSVDTFYLTIAVTGVESLPGFNNLTGFKVYPNPGNEFMWVNYQLNNNSAAELSVVDLYGRKKVVMNKTEMAKGLHKFNIDMSDLAGGIYIVQLNIDGYSHQQRWIKIH